MTLAADAADAVDAADTRFEAFGAEHLVLLVVFAVGLGAVVAWGRRHAGTPAEGRAARGFAVALAVVAVAMQAYQLTPGDFDVDTSLPLALCDLATVLAVVALWTRSSRATAFVYYVGLTLTVQGVLTPSLGNVFPHPRYFGFWALHFLVVWAAAYLTWGLRIRPTWRGYRFTVTAVLVWAVATFAFNVAADTNYGYLNAKPTSASALDWFGPWPVYVGVVVALLCTVWAVVMTLPWTRGRARSDRSDRTARGPVRERSRRT
jgi:hypothetical integral membrane protein (TIGR02206 family)